MKKRLLFTAKVVALTMILFVVGYLFFSCGQI